VLPTPNAAGTGAEPPSADPIAAALTDEPPQLLTAGVPRYPELLRQAGVTGRVVVGGVISTTGRPERETLRVVQSTHAGFNEAAVAYVAGALFRPGRKWGAAVRVEVHVPVEFRLTR
jgi:TonB family protein